MVLQMSRQVGQTNGVDQLHVEGSKRLNQKNSHIPGIPQETRTCGLLMAFPNDCNHRFLWVDPVESLNNSQVTNKRGSRSKTGSKEAPIDTCVQGSHSKCAGRAAPCSWHVLRVQRPHSHGARARGCANCAARFATVPYPGKLCATMPVCPINAECSLAKGSKSGNGFTGCKPCSARSALSDSSNHVSAWRGSEGLRWHRCQRHGSGLLVGKHTEKQRQRTLTIIIRNDLESILAGHIKAIHPPSHTRRN